MISAMVWHVFFRLFRHRKIAWPVLLGVYTLESSAADRSRLLSAMRKTYNGICHKMAAADGATGEDAEHFASQV